MDRDEEIEALRAALAAAQVRERALQDRLDGFVNNIPGIAWEGYFGESQVVDYVSDMIGPMSGYTVEEWRQPNFWLELIHPDDREAALATSRQVLQDGHGAASYRWITRDGRTLWVNSRMSLIRGDDGRPIGLRGVTMDITEVKRAEAERVEASMREELLRAQEDALLGLSTPMVPIDDELVAMPLIGTLDPRRLERVQEALLAGVAQTRAKVVILDLTGVPEMDERTADALLKTARAVALLGAEAVLTGIRPEVAGTLVAHDADLRSIVTRGTLKAGIAYAMSRRR